jgi:branched chain amino acid efflux pump
MAPGTFPALLGHRAARRQLSPEVAGIAVPIAVFGVVYGLAARNAGLSAVEAMAMSLLPFAGASQFAAIGYLGQGLSWAAIVGFTALVNARHLLYSASLASHLADVPVPQRAVMAQFLTDEAFALGTNHFKRTGRADVRGYWIAALLGVYLPWNLGTGFGALAGGAFPDPSRLGIDVVFPAAMAGLAVGLITERRELTAAAAACIIGTALALIAGPGLGVVAGGLLGPAVALAIPHRSHDATPALTYPSAPDAYEPATSP